MSTISRNNFAQKKIIFVALGVASGEELSQSIALARALITKGSLSVVATHKQYEHLLQESGIGFLDAGLCPFLARTGTPEGRALEGRTLAEEGETSGSEVLVLDFLKMLVEKWFASGSRLLKKGAFDLAILSTKTSFFVYSSLCEALSLNYALFDSSPVNKTAEFGPPRGFGASRAGFRWVNQERWDMHAKSMVSFRLCFPYYA